MPKLLYVAIFLAIGIMTVAAEAVPYLHGALPLGGSPIKQIGYIFISAVILHQGAVLWRAYRNRSRKK